VDIRYERGFSPLYSNQQRYNGAHMRTRSVVERNFGVLKSRFRCIDTSAGTLLYSPRKCCDIVIAVIVLHNMCVMNGIPLPPGNETPRDHGHIDRQPYIGNVNDGAAVRNRLINGRFSNFYIKDHILVLKCVLFVPLVPYSMMRSPQVKMTSTIHRPLISNTCMLK
jgi:hypothetical protein